MASKKNSAEIYEPIIQRVEKAKKIKLVREHYMDITYDKSRFDYALVCCRVAIEVEGGVWAKGHARGKKFLRDMKKYNYAQAIGWKVIRVPPQDLESELLFALTQYLTRNPCKH